MLLANLSAATACKKLRDLGNLIGRPEGQRLQAKEEGATGGQ